MMSTTDFEFQKHFKSLKNLKYDPDSSSYFDLLPTYQGILGLDETLQTKGSCFQDITVVAELQDNGEVKVIFDLQDSQSLFCAEAIIIATDSEFFVKDFLIS